jgi:hypothetical protein
VSLPGGLPPQPGDNPGSPGGGSNSSSGGSGSGGGGGGGSSSNSATQAAIASMTNTVLQWGIPLSRALRNLIARLAQEGASSAQFLKALRATKDYAHEFPGIMRRDGTMRMSEAAYIAGYQAAKDYAASVGRSLSQAQYGLALKNGNSPSEIRAKLTAIDTLREHGDMFREFSDYLMATGETKKPLTRKEMYAFIMKQGPKRWEDTWETAYTASQIERSGVLDIGKPKEGNDLGYKGLKKLLKQADPNLDVTKIDWSDLADLASQALPASRLYGMGITGKDLVKLKLKTKDAPGIAARVQLAIGTAVATASEQRANPQLTRQGQYTGGPGGAAVQATE